MSSEDAENDIVADEVMEEETPEADTVAEESPEPEETVDENVTLQAENADLKEKILRMAAENQNTRKRLVKQQQDAYQYRHQDIKFLKLLKNIRSQSCTSADIGLLQSRVGAKLKSKIKPVKIYTHNIDVDSLNARELAKIDETPKRYRMNSTGLEHLTETLKKHH